jgi:hypothetical protein
VERSGTLGTRHQNQVLKERKISSVRNGNKVPQDADPLEDLPLFQSGSFVIRVPRVPLRSIRRGGLLSVARSALIPQFAIRVRTTLAASRKSEIHPR